VRPPSIASSASAEVLPAFKVAFSYAGEQAALVGAIAEAVRRTLGPDTVFFAEWYVSLISGDGADVLLQKIYGPAGAVVVVQCLSAEQQSKLWTQIESNAIAERLTGDGRMSVFPLEVAVGGNTRPFETIAPQAYRHPVLVSARSIVDRLRFVESIGSEGSGATRTQAVMSVETPDAAMLDTVYVTDFEKNETLIRNAMALYESRLPSAERYDFEMMVSLVRRHLSDEFGPDWTAHFLVALFGGRTVGMLLCYEHLARRRAFISYLVAYNPRDRGTHPPDVSEELARRLMTARMERGLPPATFLFEVDDPALADNARERRNRASRLKVFGELAPFKALHLRALDLAYLQPNLNGPVRGGERPLLLCYAAPRLGKTLSKADAIALLTWTYTELYSDDVYENPSERAEWARYTHELLAHVTSQLPDPIRLLKHDEAGARQAASRS
jgi:hypothetical protein